MEQAVVARDVVTLALSFDHWVLDGEPCAAHLTYLKEFLEDPETLMD